jgi:hypothetical protein
MPDDKVELYHVACGLAELAGRTMLEAERTKFADEALSALAEAVRRGFDEPNRLKTLPAFAPLRSREEFKKLLAELDGKQR